MEKGAPAIITAYEPNAAEWIDWKTRRLLSSQVAERFQQLVWSDAEPTRIAEMPVYDLAGVK